MSHVNGSCLNSTRHVAVKGVRDVMTAAGCEPYG